MDRSTFFDSCALVIVLIILMAFFFCGCTPFEREVAEEVVHEAYVAEQAIVKDIEATP